MLIILYLCMCFITFLYCYYLVVPLPSKNVLCCHSDENGLRVNTYSVLADVQHL